MAEVKLNGQLNVYAQIEDDYRSSCFLSIPVRFSCLIKKVTLTRDVYNPFVDCVYLFDANHVSR